MDDSNRSTGGRFRPQAWPPLSAVSDNCLGTQHSALWPLRRVVLQRQTQIVCRYSTPLACTAQAATRRHFVIRSQRRARSTRYKDGSSGGAASLLYWKMPCQCRALNFQWQNANLKNGLKKKHFWCANKIMAKQPTRYYKRSTYIRGLSKPKEPLSVAFITKPQPLNFAH